MLQRSSNKVSMLFQRFSPVLVMWCQVSVVKCWAIAGTHARSHQCQKWYWSERVLVINVAAVDYKTSLALALHPLIRDSEEFCAYGTQGRENLEFFLVYLIGVRPVTLNGSSSSAVFKFTSNVNVSFSVSLRVRTRQPSTSLIDINQDQNTFFKMEVANGRVRTHYLLEGESGLILSGKSQYSSAQISGNPLYVLRVFYR